LNEVPRNKLAARKVDTDGGGGGGAALDTGIKVPELPNFLKFANGDVTNAPSTEELLPVGADDAGLLYIFDKVGGKGLFKLRVLGVDLAPTLKVAKRSKLAEGVGGAGGGGAGGEM
jgi:hypothetical protein